jgi:predicted TIM-barrel fold metal-dependent hydrolase
LDEIMNALPKIDVHIHLTGSGCCDSGCWLAPKFKKRLTFRAIKFLAGLTDELMESELDTVWAQKISDLVQASEIDYGVVLGFDQVFDRVTGLPCPTHTQMYVPPEWVFKVCKKYDNLLPGPSLNPFAKDALDKLEYCIDEGACLIKWLPATQSIDPASPKLDDFYLRLAEAQIPLLIHMGGERTFAEVEPDFGRLDRVEVPLSFGIPVICAHSVTRVLGTREDDQTPRLLELLTKYKHLYVDNSGICNPSRFAHLPRLAKDPLIMSRTLYGSDWPVPSNSIYFMGKLPLRKIVDLEKCENMIDRDVATKRSFAVPEETLTRANSVLANLDRWTSRTRSGVAVESQ